MFPSSLIVFVLSFSAVNGFSTHLSSAPTPSTVVRSAAVPAVSVPAPAGNPLANAFDSFAKQGNPLKNTFDSMAKTFDSAAAKFTAMTQSKAEEGKGAFGLAMPMAAASIASIGINSNDIMDSVSNFMASGTVGTNFEAEALNDMGHLVSDLLTVVAPALPCVPLKVAAILGRLLSIAADYAPDHQVMPDEMIFQVIMLTMSWSALVQVLRPKIVAATTLSKTYSLRDGKAYNALFQHTGMSWEQFKSLSANAMDWVDVAPNQDVPSGTDDGYTYWLYKGSMDVKNSEGKEMYTHATNGGAKQLKDGAFMGLFGETALLKCLENSTPGGAAPSTPFGAVGETQARAGAEGATFLRISTSQLKRLTDHDDSLASSMRTLLFHGLSSKLSAQFTN